MLPQEVIAALAAGNTSRYDAIRALLAHASWIVPWSQGQARCIEQEVWLFSTSEAYAAACAELSRETIGPVLTIAQIDEVIAALPAEARALRVDRSSPLSMMVSGEELEAFVRMVQGVRLERAMAERDLARVYHGDYIVPYYGELGRGHEIICLPVQDKTLVLGFTSEDAIHRFLETGPEQNRTDVKFIEVSGADLFTEAAPAFAEGVVINIAGPRTFAFDLETCASLRELATAS